MDFLDAAFDEAAQVRRLGKTSAEVQQYLSPGTEALPELDRLLHLLRKGQVDQRVAALRSLARAVCQDAAAAPPRRLRCLRPLRLPLRRHRRSPAPTRRRPRHRPSAAYARRSRQARARSYVSSVRRASCIVY
jgi:hypothetical protein